jgi:hypothetical protein
MCPPFARRTPDADFSHRRKRDLDPFGWMEA